MKIVFFGLIPIDQNNVSMYKITVNILSADRSPVVRGFLHCFQLSNQHFIFFSRQ
jgi:hypothetical protein